jgi:hypothetical protein
VWAILFGAATLFNGRLWWQKPGLEALWWSLALTPLVSPFIWSWDFVLLLPLFVWCLFHLRSRVAQVILGAGYLVNWYLMMRVILTTDGSDHYFWWGSWFLMLVMIAGIMTERCGPTMMSPGCPESISTT